MILNKCVVVTTLISRTALSASEAPRTFASPSVFMSFVPLLALLAHLNIQKRLSSLQQVWV